jgi:hypothetical protein
MRITGRKTQAERAQSFTFEKSVRPSRDLISPNQSTSTSSKDGAPVLYPAMLSEVAVAFKERVTVGTKIKNSIKYKDTFDGVEAVVRQSICIHTHISNPGSIMV